ncbi:phosphoadenylyl-sulfate reductase [Sphingomonas sp.]|uniref:phosphoadenylyl-sulfate reductase n=1 Tax=Sphingomonas sp. TaxID=28214 RepID=UPI003CC629E1
MLAEALERLIARAPAADDARWVFTTSFGLEDQAITHAIATAGLAVEIVTLDTGRLFAETQALWAATEARYGLVIAAYAPDADAVAALVAADGEYGMYDSKRARLACCDVRKVAPLARALDGAAGWVTGLRGARGATPPADLAWDDAHHLWKANPLAAWPRDAVAAYCTNHAVPVSPLHARGYPSLGCEPCTRAVKPGEDERAGRWWWEQGQVRECGLHVTATQEERA